MDIWKYIKGVLRWWWLLLLGAAIAGSVSYVVTSRQPKIYSTSTTLIVGQVFEVANPSAGDFFTLERLAESYAQIARRQPILQATIDSLNLDMDWQSLKWQIYVYQVPQTQLLEVIVSDASPERAVKIADEIAHQLILQSPSSPDNQARQERGSFVQAQLDDLEQRIEASQARIATLHTELASAISARQIQDLQTEISNLSKVTTEWQANYSDLLTFLQGGDSSNYLAIIEPAQLSYVPISPNVRNNVVLAAAAGFALAFGAALLLVFLDDTVKSADDFTEASGLSSLGVIIRIQGKSYQEKLISRLGPFAPASESYRMIRSNIRFMAVGQPPKSLLITSPVPSAGKSTTASNLAVIMAQADLKTIIVDADLRRPVLHKVFGLPNLVGLSNLIHLVDEIEDVNDYMHQTNIPNLRVMTSGPLPPNPAELLGSGLMNRLIERLSQVADLVIIDTPPTLAVTDAVALSNKVDGVILVSRAGQTRRSVIQQSVKTLERVGANLLGGIVNDVTKRQQGYQYYQYNNYSSLEATTGAEHIEATATKHESLLWERNGKG